MALFSEHDARDKKSVRARALRIVEARPPAGLVFPRVLGSLSLGSAAGMRVPRHCRLPTKFYPVAWNFLDRSQAPQRPALRSSRHDRASEPSLSYSMVCLLV